MSEITPSDVKKIATLARLELNAAEVDLFTHQLGEILQYIDKLSEVEIDGVEPFLNAAAGENVFRDDIVRDSLPRDAALANAPKQGGGFFKVPEVIQ